MIVMLVDYFIGSFACCYGGFLVGKILLKTKFRDIKWYSYLLLALFSILSIIVALIFDSILKIIIILTFIIFIYKLIFKTSLVDSIIYAIITYIFFILGEVTVTIIMSLINFLFKKAFMYFLIKTILGNLLVVFFSLLYAFLLRKIVVNVINKLNRNKIPYVALSGVITIFITISTLYKLYLNDFIIDYKFVLNIVIIFGSLILTLILIKEYLKNKDITEKYILLDEYLKTSAELIEKYGSTIHKYKNNLITIKGYLKTNPKEANNYIDSLLDNHKSKKYSWFFKINYIKKDVVRYLVYYKLSKAEEKKLKISVDVSQDMKNYKEDNLTKEETNILLDVLGEYFDNAIYASNESLEKELSLVIYNKDKKVYIVLANTYKEKFDINSISKLGYTTKGKGHGLGLYDIDKSLKDTKRLSTKYELISNYFVVTLCIDNNKEIENENNKLKNKKVKTKKEVKKKKTKKKKSKKKGIKKEKLFYRIKKKLKNKKIKKKTLKRKINSKKLHKLKRK